MPLQIDLVKPVTVLTERICDALGALALPWQMKRIARTENEVALIKAEGAKALSQFSHLSDQERRGIERLVHETAREQANIEDVWTEAIKHVNADATPQDMSADWITNFFKKCRHFSDPEAKQLWGRVLAGEANSPGSFSRRTIDLLASMDQRDAELFQTLCRFSLRNSTANVVFIFSLDEPVYVENGMTADVVVHLEALGLISVQLGPGGLFNTNWPAGKIKFVYSDNRVLEIEAKKEINVKLGRVHFTRFGSELASICSGSSVPGFLDYVAKKISASDRKITIRTVTPGSLGQ